MPRWQFHEFEQLGSTNDLAKELPHWSAVRADSQNAGRGQRGRQWHSDQGGLWASYTLPCPDFTAPSLVFGAAITLNFRRLFGLPQMRMRYPNDLMVGPRKLAGILIESPAPDTLVFGIGINLNNPLPPDESLRSPATRLADWLPQPPAASELFRHIAELLRHCLEAPPDPNAAWADEPIEVEIQHHGGPSRGLFLGTSPSGALLIKSGDQLREIAGDAVLEFRECALA